MTGNTYNGCFNTANVSCSCEIMGFLILLSLLAVVPHQAGIETFSLHQGHGRGVVNPHADQRHGNDSLHCNHSLSSLHKVPPPCSSEFVLQCFWGKWT